MFKVLKNGKMPTRGSRYSAAVDLYSSEDVVIGVGETVMVGLGVCIDLQKSIMSVYEETAFSIKRNVKSHNLRFPSEWTKFLNSYYLQLMLRSSLGKKGLIIPNGVGVIDLDYKDEIKVLIHNPIKFGDVWAIRDMQRVDELHIKKGDNIAQITLLEHKSYLMNIESNNERVGGFGSTNKS